jgi:hypothetical protein
MGGLGGISFGGGGARIRSGGGRARGGRGRGRNTQALFGLGVLGAGPSHADGTGGREGGARGAIPLFL